MVEVTLVAAFIAGIISFLSPCVLPLIPGFLAYLSGTGIGDKEGARFKMFLNSGAFVIGFSVVFALLGVLLNTLLESVSYQAQLWLSRTGGIIIILFALYMLGIIKLKFLEQEHTLKVKKKFSISYVTSFVFGGAFAVGWTPCVGAVLGSVLALAVTQPGLSFALLIAYSIGLGLPFLFVGAFSAQALAFIKRYGNLLKYFNLVVGILLLILGILVFTQTLGRISSFGALNSFLLS